MIKLVSALILLLCSAALAQLPTELPVLSIFNGGVRLDTGGLRPGAVAAGDFNGDQQQDLACTNFVSNGISVFLGVNSDPPPTPQAVVTGSAPTGIASGDLNGDEFDDLVVANTASNTASVIFGDPAGVFNNSALLVTGQSPVTPVVADLSGDALADIAVTNRLSGDVSIFINNGDETFSAATSVPVGIAPLGVAAGLFDGDSAVDLVVANSLSDDVTILFNRNNGSDFTLSRQVSVTTEPVSVAVDDLNNDGKNDILVASRRGGALTELRGDGLGGFAVINSLQIQGLPTGLAVADVGGDGFPDVVMSRYESDDILLFLNDGRGNLDLTQQLVVGDGPVFVLLSDLDGDFTPEMISVNNLENTLYIAENLMRAKAIIRFPLPEVSVAGRVAVVAQLVSGSPRRIDTSLGAGVRFQFQPQDGDQPWADIPASDATPNPDLFPPYAVFWDTSQLTPGNFLLRAIATDVFLGPDAQPKTSTATIADPETADEYENLTADNLHEKIARLRLNVLNRVASTDSLKTNLTAIVELQPDALTKETRLRMLFPLLEPFENALRSFENDAKAFVQVSLEDPTAAGEDFGATIQISYPDEDQDGYLDGTNIDEKFMTIRVFDAVAGIFKNIPTAVVTVDTEQNMVSATTRSFSTFGAMGIISGTLIGKVARSGGEGIEGARIEAGGSGSPDALTTFSVDLGDYIIATAPIGTYDLSASATGYQNAARSAVSVQTGQTVTANFQLSTGGSNGNGNGNNTPPCVLATGVRHTGWSPLLDPIRRLRDSNLLSSPLASYLVQTYYRLSAAF